MKRILVASVIGLASLVHTPGARASLWTDVRDTVTAPARAVPEVIKHPSPTNIAKAASPAVAQTAEVDNKLGVSQKVEDLAKIPSQVRGVLSHADDAVGNANQTVNDARNAIGESQSLIADLGAKSTAVLRNLEQYLGHLALPVLLILYVLLAWVSLKFVQALRSVMFATRRAVA